MLESNFEMGSAWRSLEQAFETTSLKRELACCFHGGEATPLGREFSVLRNPELTNCPQPSEG